MSNEKRYRQLGGGDFFKWTDAGQELEGIWRGQHDGKFGALGTITTPDGDKVFPLHTALLNMVEQFKEGQGIKLVYKGSKLNPKTSREFKDFDIYIVEEDEKGEGVPF